MAIIKLTPELFRELDILARREGGKPLKVVDWRKMEGAFAQQSVWAAPLYVDINKPHLTEKGVIEIANQIDTDKFYSTKRPELDWRAIPKEQIYRFLVLHEIGHIKCGINLVDLFKFFPLLGYEFIQTEEGLWMEWPPREVRLRAIRKRNMAIMASELLADRYAWTHLFPDKDLPIRKGTKTLRKRIEAFIRRHSRFFPSEPRKPNPLPIDPTKFVPREHVEQGIPWAV